MSNEIERSIDAIKRKLKDMVKDKNQTQIALELSMNKNYFSDLKKKKSFTISELITLSEKFDFNLFSLIRIKTNKPVEHLSEEKHKKTRIAITIEVQDEQKERVILESLFDKPTVKKILEN